MVVSSPERPAVRGPARVPRVGPRDREYWQNIRYLVFGRAVPMMVFGFLGYLQVRRIVAVLPPRGLGDALDHVVPQAFYAAFCAIPVLIYLARPRPSARDGSLGARAAAFTGTCMQLVVGVWLPTGPAFLDPPSWAGPVATALSAAAWAFALWGIAYLRRSLSIIPEARRLTTSGPYRFVRHPLYAAEITAAAGAVLTGFRVIPTVAFLVFVAMQLTRTLYEERLLRRVFPEYRGYASRTARLVPFVL